MSNKIRISLEIPHPTKAGLFFSLRLKEQLVAEQAESQEANKVLVISDIGSDFGTFCKVLFRHKLINKYLKWIFEDGHLVILGNCFDNSDGAVECLWLIYSLEEQAIKRGGRIHFILSDSEIMNLNGPWRHKQPKYANSKELWRSSSTILYDANHELWRWLYTKNVMEKIGNIIFMHREFNITINKELTINELNKFARSTFHNEKANRFTFLHNDVTINNELQKNKESKNSLFHSYLNFFKGDAIITVNEDTKGLEFVLKNEVINPDIIALKGRIHALLIKRNVVYIIGNDGKKIRVN